MTVNAFFERCRRANAQANKLRGQLDDMMEHALSATGKVSAIRNGGTSSRSKVEDGVVELAEAETLINRYDADAAVFRATACIVIEIMARKRQRQILALRYVRAKSWEEIAEAMKCNVRWVRRLHDQALLEADKILQYYKLLT